MSRRLLQAYLTDWRGNLILDRFGRPILREWFHRCDLHGHLIESVTPSYTESV